MILKTFAGAAMLGAFALAGAGAASADTTSVVNVGNDNLGYSVGTTGGSAAIAGYRTTVDGIGTLHGQTTVTMGGNELVGVRQSYTNGFQSTTSFINNQSRWETEAYYDGTIEQTWTDPKTSFSLVCRPFAGCTTESG